MPVTEPRLPAEPGTCGQAQSRPERLNKVLDTGSDNLACRDLGRVREHGRGIRAHPVRGLLRRLFLPGSILKDRGRDHSSAASVDPVVSHASRDLTDEWHKLFFYSTSCRFGISYAFVPAYCCVHTVPPDVASDGASAVRRASSVTPALMLSRVHGSGDWGFESLRCSSRRSRRSTAAPVRERAACSPGPRPARGPCRCSGRF